VTDGRPPRIRLTTAFLVSALIVALLVVGLVFVTFDGWRRSILEASGALRDETAQRVADHVQQELSVPRGVLDDLEQGVRLGAVVLSEPASEEAALFRAIVDHPRLSEVTITRAERTGFDANGDPTLATENRSQMSVLRTETGAVVTRLVLQEDGAFVAEERKRRSPQDTFLAAPFALVGPADDPTAHPTFAVPASKDFDGRVLSSDLHWAEMDAKAPADRRRVVVSVQKSLAAADGTFLGVLRVSMSTEALDGIVHAETTPDAHVFLCDDHGALVTRLSTNDPLQVVGDDLRIVPATLPADVAAVTKLPVLRDLGGDRPTAAGSIAVEGRRFLWTLHALVGTQAWSVAVVVPESHYTAPLARLLRPVAVLGAVMLLLLFVLGVITLRGVRRGFGEIADRTRRMRDFDFSPLPVRSPYADVHEAIDALERAKTAVRALGKYVPVDLVRTLHARNEDPKLGGELRELSILFTDIEGFTTLSEKLSPDALAEALGRYLQAMTEAIEAQRGVIDKYVGDAVMALWNAPAAVDDHPARACRAALDCIAATERLFASDAWKGLPALHTRFGLHRDTVLVGHFGAPTRLSYTALGDGVNLAARLEGLCKQYDVTILASQSIVEGCNDRFAFRRLDVVAVKGKKHGVEVYELLGDRDRPRVATDVVQAYEAAFDKYRARAFDDALEILSRHPGDAPSRVLADRCAAFKASPPPSDWDGVWIARSK